MRNHKLKPEIEYRILVFHFDRPAFCVEERRFGTCKYHAESHIVAAEVPS